MIITGWRIILKRALHKYGVRMWTELKCIRTGSNEAFVNTAMKIRVPKLRFISFYIELLSASKKENSPPTSAEDKQKWNYTSTPTYTFMA
jgi:hypothetical protein